MGITDFTMIFSEKIDITGIPLLSIRCHNFLIVHDNWHEFEVEEYCLFSQAIRYTFWSAS